MKIDIQNDKFRDKILKLSLLLFFYFYVFYFVACLANEQELGRLLHLLLSLKSDQPKVVETFDKIK